MKMAGVVLLVPMLEEEADVVGDLIINNLSFYLLVSQIID
jgi:hypothetical protein